jgi:plasmid stability protein
VSAEANPAMLSAPCFTAKSTDLTVFLCYCADMKNLTVTVPDDIYREARIRAAERGTSVSALVTEYLRSLSGPSSEFIRLRDAQREIVAGITGFRAADRLERDQVHARGDRAVR